MTENHWKLKFAGFEMCLYIVGCQKNKIEEDE